MNDFYAVKRIFIATPSDLIEERQIFRDMCTEANNNKAHCLGIHIKPLGWEDTLPGIGRPQELINHDLNNADLFILVLWKRWGTATDKYSSGTEEEFELARQLNSEAGKPEIMAFFKEPIDIHPDEYDDIKRIEAFRKKIEDDKILLFKEVKDTKDWEHKLRWVIYTWLDSVYKETVQHIDERELVVSEILVEVSYTSWIRGNSKDIIYFTIKDPNSLEYWTELSPEEKKRYLFAQTSQYLYLILGAKPYVAILRYNHNHQSILLGQVSFIYGSSIEHSRFLIPNQPDCILGHNEEEETLSEWHARMPVAPTNDSTWSKEIDVVGLCISQGHTYIDVDRLCDALEIDSRNTVWNEDSRTLTLVYRDKVIQYTESSNKLVVNGVSIDSAIAPLFIDEDVKWVQLKASTMAFGLNAEYDSTKLAVRITGRV